jgi:hypothetical protein
MFYKLLNQEIVNTDALLIKLSYNDWGYLHEISADLRVEDANNVTNMRRFGCTVDYTLLGKNNEEVNRKCYFPVRSEEKLSDNDINFVFDVGSWYSRNALILSK